MEKKADNNSPRMLVLFALLLGMLLSALVYVMVSRPRRGGIMLSTPLPAKGIMFEIYGAVQTPGVYQSDSPIRVSTAVAMAGGLTDDAALELSHMSGWVDDAGVIFIPTLGGDLPTSTPVPSEKVLVDLNNADLAMLMTLPGIGEKKAADILELRNKKGGFTSPDELLEVNGIGPSMLEKIYDLLVIRDLEEK